MSDRPTPLYVRLAADSAARLDEVGDPAGSLMAAARANSERLFPRIAAARG